MATHLVRRAGRYYIRRRIPTDLLPYFEGKKEIQQALGTSNPRDAAVKCRLAGAALDAKFERARQSASIQPSTPPVGVWHATPRDQLEGEEEEAADYAKDEHEAEKFEALKAAIRAVVAEGGLGVYPLSPYSPAMPPVVPVATSPASNSQHSATGVERTLESLSVRWANERSPAPRTKGAMKTAVQRFHDHVGAVPVPAITKGHIVDFKDKLLQAGLTAKNTNFTLLQIGILLNFAVDQAWIHANPSKGVKVRVDARQSARDARIPYSEVDLNRIFSGPVYTEGFRPVGGAGEAAYWLPLLGLFTGARIEELCQLRPEDIYEERYRDAQGKQAQCWVMRITDDGEGQSLKNAGSRRRIPIHKEILDRGFIQYVHQQAGKKTIFPLRADKDGRNATRWSDWWHRYQRETLKITDPRLVFHSHRHGWKDIARECGIEKGLRDAAQGHSEKGAAGGYGAEYFPLRPLVEAMEKFRIHGVSLPAKS